MTSIKSVAKRAGVSIATVSRVLNDTKYVSPSIREKVLNAVEELNYIPSITARNLRRQQTQSIGVLVPHLNDLYFSGLAFAIEKELTSSGYSPLFASTESDVLKESLCVDNLMQHGVEGVIFVPSLPVSDSVENVQRLLAAEIAVVLVDRAIPTLRVNQVISNNFQGGYDAAQYLIGLGHKHIGLLDGGTDALLPKSGPGRDRIAGVQQAMAEAGMEFNPKNFVFTDDQNQSGAGYKGMFTLLHQSPEITAVFALTDACAVGVLRAAYEMGLSVPRDISVMGFDDIPLASHAIPRLTTLAQPPQPIAQAAINLLIKHLNEPNSEFQTINVGTRLVVRESTAPPPG
ncbi:MAG: LacI family DNA-binding transcriptional regulator [Anaerolineae bacterium]